MLKIKYNILSSSFSFIGVGGKVKLYIETDDINVIKKILKVSKKIKYIGNTSNIFFSFFNSEYIYIKYINRDIRIDNFIELGSSLSLNYVSHKMINLGLEGFEKISSIPGYIGGSLVNNASCFNQCISDYLYKIICLDKYGNFIELYRNNIDFKHHFSSLRNDKILIIKAYFLKKFKSKEILKLEKEKCKEIRMISQPVNKLTLGSTFRKYDDICIPKLIEDLNLKGKTKGGYKISNIHSNFIEIGKGDNFLNILSLIEETNQLLYNKLGYYIDLEIERIKR